MLKCGVLFEVRTKFLNIFMRASASEGHNWNFDVGSLLTSASSCTVPGGKDTRNTYEIKKECIWYILENSHLIATSNWMHR
jgi:hypothetical protein